MKVIDLIKSINVRQRYHLVVIIMDVDLPKQMEEGVIHENVLYDDEAYPLLQEYRKYNYIRDREVLYFTLGFNTLFIKIAREKIKVK